MTRLLTVVVFAAMFVAAGRAHAQSLGTLRWQLQPFCNVVSLNVNQQGAVYTLDGYDDQCGAAQRAPLVGLATPNPDGTIGFGMNVVTVPGGLGVQIDARITLATVSGPWSDSAGNSGTFAFGASTGGSPRPAPATGGGGGTTIPPTFALLADGGFLARGTISVGTIPASGTGTRMMWYPKKASFRAGEITTGPLGNDANIGSHSTAFGLNSAAIGPYSFAAGVDAAAVGISGVALGNNVAANGNYSVAFGAGTRANGAFSTVFGRNTTAGGDYSTVFGFNSFAPGHFSAAFGNTSTAAGSASVAAGTSAFTNGSESVAMGLRVSAGGNGSVVLGSDATAATTGTFMYGDRSTTNGLTTAGSNEFLVRAAGGTIFYSNAAMTTGVILNSGLNAWQGIGVSDEHRKTNFRDLDGEQVLGKLAAMPVREWSYTTQDAAIRHVGPTAQDFRAAFGLGESDVRIGSVDADGIALAAVKALEARTRELNEKLTRENDELRARLTRLESRRDKR